MKTNKTIKSCLALLLIAVMVLAAAGCTPSNTGSGDKTYTYNTYTALSPSNWNELTYKDNNDTQIMNYLGSSFFSYDFKFDENGDPIPGEFVMKYEAATKLEDVSADYVGDKWGIKEGATGMAYKITLREDLKWDDGTPIKAEDFVYTIEQLLDPKFQNYRADTMYIGGTVLVNAQNYAKQGQTVPEPADNIFTTYSADLDSKLFFHLAPKSDTFPAQAAFRGIMGFAASHDLAFTQSYLVSKVNNAAFTTDIAAAMEGKSLAEIKADAAMKAAWDALIGWWQTEPNEELHFFTTEYTYPETKFEDVGIFVGDSEYEIVLVLAKALPLLKEDGSLSYQAAYNMASLPLVHKEKYEANKVAPSTGTTLWTTTYNTSVETTASWGPYKLESFQPGTQYVLTRNENWYGYAQEENKGLYQTDKIVCDTIKEWNAAWLKFQAGQIDGIGIDVSIADDYKGSERAYFTPDDYVASLQLQSSKDGLKAREEAGINKTLMSYTDFRKALSLAINRAEFATKTTTSSKAGFGLFNSMHYYDVENGGVYRNSDEAKKVLCNVYAVDYTKYDNLDKAVESITGYNLDEARKLVDKAYDEALAAGDIKAGDKVKLTMGSGAINEVVTRRFNYIKDAWLELVKGTKLEGKLEFDEIKDFGDAWADDFMAGDYDVCMGGWTGAAWDPGYFLLAYIGPGTMFSEGWDTANTMMTFTMKGVGEGGSDITETMGLLDWYDCLNGASDAKYDWSANALEQSQRLQLIAALEEQVLAHYYSVPLYNNFSASLLSYKVDYITYEYNTFMAYGGMKYMKYNFTDAEWAAEVAKNNGELNYK